MRLAVVVGHTEVAKGADMIAPFSFIREYDYNKVLAALIKSYCVKINIDCGIFFRDKIGIEGAYLEVKKFAPSCVIELHFNSHDDNRISGTEVLYGSIKGSDLLASAIQDQLCRDLKRMGKQNRGVKETLSTARGGSNVNNQSGIPSVLIEPFFGSNLMDANLALERITEIAKSIVDGIVYWSSRNPRKYVDIH